MRATVRPRPCAINCCRSPSASAEFEAWRRGRQARRLKELPPPAFIELEGFAANDTKRLDALLARHVGVPLDIDALEQDLAIVAGLDRYETVTWRMTRDSARGYGLRVRGRAKTYAPPFMMLGVNLENTTSSDFRITATARYLAYDVVGSGSELRLDGTIGSDPTLAGGALSAHRQDAVVRRAVCGCRQRDLQPHRRRRGDCALPPDRSRVGLNVGVNLGARSDVRVGAYIGRSTASITVGDPGFPELRGKETGAEIVWRLDTQDSSVVPSVGLLSAGPSVAHVQRSRHHR